MKLIYFICLLSLYYTIFIILSQLLDLDNILIICYNIFPLLGIFILYLKYYKKKKLNLVLPEDDRSFRFTEIYYPSNKVDIVIHSEPVIYSELTNCPICFDDYFIDKLDSIKLECGHIHHKKCIKRWLNYNNTCPLCRVHIIDSYET